MSIQARVVALAAVTILAASSAQAASVKEIFEKYNLIGTYAADCSKPVSTQNHYYVHRLLNADFLQRDIMESPTTRTFLVIISSAADLGPNQLSIGGTRDGKPFTSVYQVEPNRIRVLESTVDGRLEITNGRIVNGGQMPWHNKCGVPTPTSTIAPSMPLPPPHPELTVEVDLDRPGMDFENFELGLANHELCRDACGDRPICVAYTYVKPGLQGPNARCWLKSSVPAPRPSNCCVSGVRN
jgi:hypothetical protein